MPISERRNQVALLFTVAAVIASVFMFMNAPVAPAHSLATCSPIAHDPVTSNGSAAQNGEVTCDPGNPGYSYDNRLATAGGTDLNDYDDTVAAPAPLDYSLLNNGFISCGGNQVHTFVYINVGGAGKSDTSGNVSC